MGLDGSGWIWAKTHRMKVWLMRREEHTTEVKAPGTRGTFIGCEYHVFVHVWRGVMGYAAGGVRFRVRSKYRVVPRTFVTVRTAVCWRGMGEF